MIIWRKPRLIATAGGDERIVYNVPTSVSLKKALHVLYEGDGLHLKVVSKNARGILESKGRYSIGQVATHLVLTPTGLMALEKSVVNWWIVR